MNADDFYQDFKDALEYLGLPWGQKQQALVWLDGEAFCLAYGGRETRVRLPRAASTSKPPAPPTNHP